MRTFSNTDHPRGAAGKFTQKSFPDASNVILDPTRRPVPAGATVRLATAAHAAPLTGQLVEDGQTGTFGNWTIDIHGNRFRRIGVLETAPGPGDPELTFPMNPEKVSLWRGLFPRRQR